MLDSSVEIGLTCYLRHLCSVLELEDDVWLKIRENWVVSVVFGIVLPRFVLLISLD